MSWKSPTGYNDPDESWESEEHTYDENTSTYAAVPEVGMQTWSDFLELLISPAILCDKVRFYYGNSNYITQVDIDVYYDGNWHNVYQGTFGESQWNEETIPGGPFVISSARIRFYNGHPTDINYVHLHEFDFNQITVTIRPLVNGSLASGIGLIGKGLVR